MTPFLKPLPRYRCHKEVSALKISAAIPNPRGFELHFVDQSFVPFQVDAFWVAKHLPSDKGYGHLVGGYAVWYDDGYLSWSPASAFEEGYTAIDDVPVAPPAAPPLNPDALCRNALARDGKPFPKSNCQRCGTLMRPGWTCADGVEVSP